MTGRHRRGEGKGSPMTSVSLPAPRHEGRKVRRGCSWNGDWLASVVGRKGGGKILAGCIFPTEKPCLPWSQVSALGLSFPHWKLRVERSFLPGSHRRHIRRYLEDVVSVCPKSAFGFVSSFLGRHLILEIAKRRSLTCATAQGEGEGV